jgi:hypothetical protein
MKLKAPYVQKLLGVEDNVVVAYGYTMDRATLKVWFEKERLFRQEYLRDGTILVTEDSPDFEPSYFREKVKRWYLGEGLRRLNPMLQDLFETFGNPLSTTSGGNYP